MLLQAEPDEYGCYDRQIHIKLKNLRKDNNVCCKVARCMEEELEILEDVSPLGLKRSRDSAVDIGAENDDNGNKKYRVRKDDIFVKN